MFIVLSLFSSVLLIYCYHAFIFMSLIFIVSLLLWTTLLILFYEVSVGDPPIKELYLAYKYTYLSRSSRIYFKKLYKWYPDNKLVKLCYSGPKSSHIEYANAVVVSEAGLTFDTYMLEHLIENGLSFFKTPSITHAISLNYPIISWVPATKWLAIALAYPKLFRYIKDYNLCAYPVMELYTKSSITIMVPLLRQDEFVVKEAERLVGGRKYSAMLTPITPLDYVSQEKKIRKRTTSTRANKGERKG